MAKSKKISNLPKYLIVAVISSFVGALCIYILISRTTIIPINYFSKYFQIYDANKTPTTDVYIDLVRGFKFNYSPIYEIANYSPTKIDKMHVNNSILELSRGKSKIRISGIIPVGETKTAMEYAKISNSSIFAPITDAWKYREGEIDGADAVFTEFEMTQKIYDALPETVFGKGMSNPNIVKKEQPVGYLGKKVFFKKGDVIYTISSNNLENPAQVRAYETVVNSFKFLF